MVKLTTEGVEKYPHFFGNVVIMIEDETRYRIRASDNRRLWIEKKFINEDKLKEDSAPKVSENEKNDTEE